MSEDRTTPMQQPQKPRRQTAADADETVQSGAPGESPPTLPASERPQDYGFVRAVPADTPTPPPFQQPGTPFAPPGYQAPAAPGGETMLVGERRAAATFAWLVVVDAPDRRAIGKVHTLQPDATTLGRVQGNHIVINDDACSGLHARIRVETREKQEPAYVLYDLGSANGTFIGTRESYRNAESQKYRHELQDGDYILIGETTLVFKKV